MDAQTLVKAVAGHVTLDYAEQLVDGCNQALRLVGANTPARVAMLLAQCAEESVAFHALTEYASGQEYEGRRDLGNIYPGDGPRFKGRSFIQITGRANYTNLSRYLYGKGVVPTATYFLDHPTDLGTFRYAWDGPVFYWNVARPQLNALADAHDIVGATKAVNGGTNGLDVREFYWRTALALGDALLPSESTPGAPMSGDLTPQQGDDVRNTVTNALRAVMLGQQSGKWTHKLHSWLIPAHESDAIIPRLARLESAVQLMLHTAKTNSRTVAK